MQEPELHDLSDDADYAASIQQGSASIMKSESCKRSSSNEPKGAEIVYTKDNVTIHPSQYASERISGRLKLIKQGNSLFMTWIPYKGQCSDARLSEKETNLYTIRAVPFSDIRSIRRHMPTLGWQYIIVVMSSGLAFPPLYFYNGGVREILATIKQHVFLVRSAEDSNVFVVNDFQNPLQRTLSSLDLPLSVSVANAHSPTIGANESLSSADLEKGESDKNSGNYQKNGKQRQKLHDPARDLLIQVLEKFSLVTRFARETTSQLFRETQIDGFTPNDERTHGQLSPEYHHIIASNDSPKVPDVVSVPSDPVEFDKLSLVWGKPRQPPLEKEEWTTFLDAKGRVMDSKALRKRIFYGGVERDLRKEIWTFLLGFHAYDSTYAEREYLMSVKKSEYEIIKKQWQNISVEQAKRFTKFRDRKGLIDKDVVRTDRSLLFYDGDDNPNVYLLRDILLTYSFYNFDLGYCQGMSDLLSPILYVMRDESKSFWCFVSLMERLGPNFNRDQSGMHSQLFALSKLVELLDSPLHNYFKQNDCLNYFFCFRWILIQFKRSAEDSNVFVVNDFQNPLQRTLSSLDLPLSVSVANAHSPTIGANESLSSADLEKGESDKNSGNYQKNGKQRQKLHDPARDLLIQVLEKFSLVTRFARETTSQLFRETQIDGFTPNDERTHGQLSPEYHHIIASNDSPKVPDVVSVPSDPVEFVKLSLVWGKPRQPPLEKEEWTTFLDAKGRVMDSKALRKRIFYGGVERDLRKEIWTFLLGFHAYDSTYAEREYLMSVKKSEYEIIKKQWQNISVEQAKRFTKFRDRKGLIDKDVVRTDRSLLFYDGDDNPNVYLLRDILLTYSFYNFDLGYCQGMSDLLSPILYVMRDESKSFWCFVSLMERLGPNFNRDQSGMHSQLFALSKLVELLDSPLHNYFKQNDCLNYFFCFRWILIQFKREFEYDRTMRLWEVLWTHYLSEHLHLYVCVAILKRS